MKIKLSKPLAISSHDIDDFIQETGVDLPEEFAKFLLEYNGARPETNIFSITELNESGVDKFIPLSLMIEESARLENIGASTFPIAWAEGGNYVVINFDKEASVYFWDHEEPSQEFLLAKGIYKFLEKLEAFDPESVVLKDGQIESAWIDPDFLKSLE
ncbi:SMI1/KNR4 family protein [Vibrio sp. 99-8-1]|uniref:SMI1/KNR4 family protein n=1 Tax=Vibrio sp. 99-8-1 TaxID=2607602 RepID=UPI00149364E8|nr:SMI1/KNR4 family protein [Vibrio sp. 99-8-1]NOI67057.1 SMI1/KNR4 family protein [Vibrio sp. 99-8-1]